MLSKILLCIHFGTFITLQIFPEYEQRGFIVNTFGSSPIIQRQLFSFQFITTPKIVIGIQSLQYSSGISFSVYVSSVDVDGFYVTLTLNQPIKLNIVYFAFSDDNLEQQFHCSSSTNELFNYQREYNRIPQVMTLLTGFKISNVFTTPYYLLTSQSTMTSYQTNMYMHELSIDYYCFSALIGDQLIIQQFYIISDFHLAPVFAPANSSSLYLYQGKLVQAPLMIGMIGSKYSASANYYVSVVANPPNYQVYTYATTYLYVYATSSAMYTPLQCQISLSTNLCLPICGDGIRHSSEQCDDGNTTPFDGCFNCLYECIEQCASCQQGQCQQCQIGFNLTQFSCQPICGDGLIRAQEQCDDSSPRCQNCILTCQVLCVNCSYGNCYQCIHGYYVDPLNQCQPICGDQEVLASEQCDDGNEIRFDGCYNCQFSCPLNCNQCFEGICVTCQNGYYNLLNLCEPICGDGIVVGLEECDTVVSNTQYCQNCKYQCNSNCLHCSYDQCQQCLIGYMLINNICMSICGDMLMQPGEQCDDGNMIPSDGCWNCRFDCPLNCQSCLNGSCQGCNPGYYLTYQSQSYQLRTPNFYLECNSKCGDSETVGNEICDDGNNSFFDGCYNCNLSCQQSCQQCSTTLCRVCKPGYNLYRGNCYSVCGDGLVVSGESCDDANSFPFDGCHQCQQSCPQYCLQCSNGYCLSCQIGFYLQDNICFSICGDNILAQNEQCDDGNINIYSGCFDCKFQCPYATYLFNEGCHNICGDGLFAQDFEQCDDGNVITADGCSQCRIDLNYTCESNDHAISQCYICPTYCANCSTGKCKACQTGYFLSQNFCIQCSSDCVVCLNNPSQCLVYATPAIFSVCGNGTKEITEQCDHGNLNSYDGCDDQCLIESKWLCNQQSIPNTCELISIPSLVLQSIVFEKGQYYIKVGLDDVCLIFNIDSIALNLNFSDNNLNYIVQPLFNKSDKTYQNISYQIILNPISYIPNLYVNLKIQNRTFQTKQGIILKQIANLLDLSQIQYISINDQRMLEGLVSFNNYIMYLIIAVAAISILTGSFEPVLNMLDLIQQFSYLQWINIYFPYLLELYLNIFKMISIDYVIDYLRIHFNYPYQQSDFKLLYYEVNSYLYENLQSFIVSIMYCYLIYFLTTAFCKNSIREPVLKVYLKTKWQFTMIQLYKSTLQMHFSGVIQIIMTSTFDITTALLLYCTNDLFTSEIDYAKVCTAISIGFTILLMVGSSTINNPRKMLKSMKEGVNLKRLSQRQYYQYVILKKLLFCFIIIDFQQNGVIQVILISMNSLAFSGYLILNKPLKSSSEFAKILMGELVISFQTLSFIIYDLQIMLNFKQYMQWINITLFSMLLTFCLIIDLVNTSRRTYKGLSKWFTKDSVTSCRDLSEI